MTPVLPTLRTERLVLRPFRLRDAATVQRLANDQRVSRSTLHIPHPYPDGVAETWISSHLATRLEDRGLVLAVTLENTDAIGAIGLGTHTRWKEAELGYWIGHDYWNRGIATEAARALIAHAIANLPIERLVARRRLDNPASGRVLEKADFQHLHDDPPSASRPLAHYERVITA